MFTTNKTVSCVGVQGVSDWIASRRDKESAERFRKAIADTGETLLPLSKVGQIMRVTVTDCGELPNQLERIVGLGTFIKA